MGDFIGTVPSNEIPGLSPPINTLVNGDIFDTALRLIHVQAVDSRVSAWDVFFMDTSGAIVVIKFFDDITTRRIEQRCGSLNSRAGEYILEPTNPIAAINLEYSGFDCKLCVHQVKW